MVSEGSAATGPGGPGAAAMLTVFPDVWADLEARTEAVRSVSNLWSAP